MAARAPVDVFAFRDYRAFLRAYYAKRKAQKDGFSLSAFSEQAALRSPNYLKLVMEGQRNLAPDMAHRFARACGLRSDAADFFCALVAFNQAKDTAARDMHYARLQRFRRYRAAHRLDAAQDAYHSQWYIPAIYELSLRADFRADPKWIARALLPKIAPRQARDALEVLRQLGLLTRDRSGKLKQAEALVETAEGPLGHHVIQFHRTMMQRAAEALDRVPREDREIGALTMCISEEQAAALKRELEAFRNDLARRYVGAAKPERVMQLNFQLFPLSAKKG